MCILLDTRLEPGGSRPHRSCIAVRVYIIGMSMATALGLFDFELGMYIEKNHD